MIVLNINFLSFATGKHYTSPNKYTDEFGETFLTLRDERYINFALEYKNRSVIVVAFDYSTFYDEREKDYYFYIRVHYSKNHYETSNHFYVELENSKLDYGSANYFTDELLEKSFDNFFKAIQNSYERLCN